LGAHRSRLQLCLISICGVEQTHSTHTQTDHTPHTHTPRRNTHTQTEHTTQTHIPHTVPSLRLDVNLLEQMRCYYYCRDGVGPLFSPGISGPRPAHFFQQIM